VAGHERAAERRNAANAKSEKREQARRHSQRDCPVPRMKYRPRTTLSAVHAVIPLPPRPEVTYRQ
jgi:hypothetical protein